LKSYLKRFSGTVIAFVIFAVLLASVLLFDKEEKTEGNPEKVFRALKTEEITSIGIKSAGSEFTLERSSGGWVVASGSNEHKADDSAIGDLIRDLSEMEVVKLVSREPDNLDEYGIVASETEFSFRAKGTEYPVIIGDKSPVGSGTYIYDLGEGRVLIVDEQYLWGFLNKTPGDFRERKLIGINKDGIERISVRAGNFSAELAKKNGEWFEVTGGETQIADQKKVKEVIDSFSGLKAEGFEDDLPGSPEKYGLMQPTAEIVFYGEGREEGVEFGKRKDEASYFVKVSGAAPVYSVSKNYFKILPKNSEDILGR
jgi:hypothetical protein